MFDPNECLKFIRAVGYRDIQTVLREFSQLDDEGVVDVES